MSKTTKCPVDIWRDFRSHTCGRSFKTDEQREAGLCGIHLRAKKMSDKARAKSIAARRESEKARSEASVAVDVLRTVGVSASVDYAMGTGSESGRYTGGVIIHRDAVPQLLKLLRGVVREVS